MEAEGTAEEDARGQRAGKEQKEASRSKNRGPRPRRKEGAQHEALGHTGLARDRVEFSGKSGGGGELVLALAS